MNKTAIDKLKKEFDWYLAHQKDLVKEFNGKYIVIKDQAVIGAYNQELEAVQKTSETHELGTFLVQLCEPGAESYTAVFHSRVTFPDL